MDQNISRTTTSMNNFPRRHIKPKVIKRYGNRKLYDTEKSSYVVLNDIAKMIRNEQEVRVIDNETKDDITSATLTQIIFGAEKRSRSSVPLGLLKSIIKQGDGSFSNFLTKRINFKSKIRDKKITIEESTGSKMAISDALSAVAQQDFRSRTTIPERVVNAVLSQGEGANSENEKTILPTSSGKLVKEKLK